jgi:hypothetical protein
VSDIVERLFADVENSKLHSATTVQKNRSAMKVDGVSDLRDTS